MAQHTLQTSVRRLVAVRPPATSLIRASVPASTIAQKRFAAISSNQTTSASPSEGITILENQRLHRPVSPHLQVYKPQITSVLSALNRITGSILSGGFYIFGAWYALGPLVGLGFSSAGLAAGFAKWPAIVKVGIKGFLAFPFVFHSANGIRHLVWDMGYNMTNLGVMRSGWTVVGLTAIGGLGLFFL